MGKRSVSERYKSKEEKAKDRGVDTTSRLTLPGPHSHPSTPKSRPKRCVETPGDPWDASQPPGSFHPAYGMPPTANRWLPPLSSSQREQSLSVQRCSQWLVGCFGFNGPLRQYFSLYRAVSQREGERGEKGQMREKMSKQPPPAPTASATGPCPTIIQISRTPRHWKFTQHLRTTRPHPCSQWELSPGATTRREEIPGLSCVTHLIMFYRFVKFHQICFSSF